MAGVWTYGLFDYDPDRDGDEEEWARGLAVQGWRTWDAGSGPWILLEGRELRRWSLRREMPEHPSSERAAGDGARPGE